MLFADLLSLHLVTFLMFLFLCDISDSKVLPIFTSSQRLTNLWHVLEVCHVGFEALKF